MENRYKTWNTNMRPHIVRIWISWRFLFSANSGNLLPLPIKVGAALSPASMDNTRVYVYIISVYIIYCYMVTLLKRAETALRNTCVYVFKHIRVCKYNIVWATKWFIVHTCVYPGPPKPWSNVALNRTCINTTQTTKLYVVDSIILRMWTKITV